MQLDLDAEAALQPVDGDLDVHLREPGEELLAGLLVTTHDERRVFLGQAAERLAELSSSPFAFGVIAKLITGFGEVEARSRKSDLLVDQHVPGLHVLQLRDRADVALAERVRREVVFPLHRHQGPHSLLRVLARVRQRRVGRDRPLEEPEDV